jgi:asparagine synthetase B (glutamine-hydrolysing)
MTAENLPWRVGFGTAGFFAFSGRSHDGLPQRSAQPIDNPEGTSALLDLYEARPACLLIQETTERNAIQILDPLAGATASAAIAGPVPVSTAQRIVDQHAPQGGGSVYDSELAQSAVARIDNSSMSMILARGTTCHLPVYYRQTHSGIRWSTNPRHLQPLRLADPARAIVTLSVDSVALSVNSGETIFEGVRYLQAGEILYADVRGTTTRRIRQITAVEHDPRLSCDQAAAGLYAAARAAIQKPGWQNLTVFLSGGVDSSALIHHLDHIGAVVLALHAVGEGSDEDWSQSVRELIDKTRRHHLKECSVPKDWDELETWRSISGLAQMPVPVERTLASAANQTSGPTVIAGGTFVDEVLRGQSAQHLSFHPLSKGGLPRVLLPYASRWLRGTDTLLARQARRLFTNQQFVIPSWLQRLARFDGILSDNLLDELAHSSLDAALREIDRLAASTTKPSKSRIHGHLALRNSLDTFHNTWLHYDLFGQNSHFLYHPFADYDFVAYGVGLPQRCKTVASASGEVIDKAAWRLAHLHKIPHASAFSIGELGLQQSIANYARKVRSQLRSDLMEGPLAGSGNLIENRFVQIVSDDRLYGGFSNLLLRLWCHDRWAGNLPSSPHLFPDPESIA